MVGITPEDAVDNFADPGPLAGKGAELATGRITPDELRDLQELAAAIDDADDVVAANRRFHRAINLRRARRVSSRTCARRSGSCRATTSSSSPSRPSAAGASTPSCSMRWRAATPPRRRRVMEAHVLSAGEALGDWLAAKATQHRGRHRSP